MLRAVELEVRHLRALLAIADTGSVHKAARQLGMSQPSLTTQLRRIEQAVGGQLFARERTGSRPTSLGRSVLIRARPLVTEMDTLLQEARDAAGRVGGDRLRIGSNNSRAVPGWLRRLHARLPETDVTFQSDVSANALLRMLATNQLDFAYVHEVEGAPLTYPPGVEARELVRREPQFMAIPANHPQAAADAVKLGDFADAQWMIDPAVDGDWDGLHRVLAAEGLAPRVVCGDYLTAADLVSAGVVVVPCQPTARPRPGVVIKPLVGDPLGVRLLLAYRSQSAAADQTEALLTDLRSAYEEIAWASEAYREWLCARGQVPPSRASAMA